MLGRTLMNGLRSALRHFPLIKPNKTISLSSKLVLSISACLLMPSAIYLSQQQQPNKNKQLLQSNENTQNTYKQLDTKRSEQQDKVNESKSQEHSQQKISKDSQVSDKNQNQYKNMQNNVINYLQSYDDVKKMNLHGHTLIWYQVSGDQAIDSEVIAMLQKFAKQTTNTISCPFKIIIDATQSSKSVRKQKYYKKQAQIVIIKAQDIKPISLNRHLSYQMTKDLSYTNLFNLLNSQINEFPQINHKNIMDFSEKLGNRSYQSHIVINAPKQNIKTNKAKRIFGSFVKQKPIFAANVNKAIINDLQSARYLGLPEYSPQGNNIYVIVPDSENIIKPGRTTIINKQKYHIYHEHQVSSSLVFPPYLQKSPSQSLIMKITADMNQNISSQLTELYEILSQSQRQADTKLIQIPKLLVFNSLTNKNSKAIQITLQKNNFQQIVNIYSPECRYSNKQKQDMLSSGTKWKYSQQKQITSQGLQNWVKDVIDQKVEPTFESEKQQQSLVKRYNSIRLTGQQYINALHNDASKPKVVFHYSQHCFSCKKFKHIYEQIAGQKKLSYNFYRIDNDFNRSKGIRNFNLTPVFVIYKQDGSSLHYKNTVFTKKLFEDFLQISAGLKTIAQSTIEKAIQDRAQHQLNLNQFNQTKSTNETCEANSEVKQKAEIQNISTQNIKKQ